MGQTRLGTPDLRQPAVDTGISTRLDTDGRKLIEPRCTSNTGFRAFRSAAPRLYNKLPHAIRMIDNLVTFKKKLKTYLFSACYNNEDSTISEAYRL